MFYLLDEADGEVPSGKILARTLAVELTAGGVSADHTQYVRTCMLGRRIKQFGLVFAKHTIYVSVTLNPITCALGRVIYKESLL